MNTCGTETLLSELAKPGYFFKAVMNDAGVVFFPGSAQHNTVKVAGLSYEDNYKGNALAVVITARRIEIRRHEGFSTARVAQIVRRLLSQPGTEILQDFRVTYHRDTIREGQANKELKASKEPSP